VVAPAAAALAKGALRRLAQAQLEPTPENYARAFAEEAGTAAPAAPAAAAEAPAPVAEPRQDGTAWAQLVERLARNLERGGRQWTAARRKDSLQRVLEGSRSDAGRLLQRLQSLMGAWEGDRPAEGLEGVLSEPVTAADPADTGDWPPLVQALESTVRAGLPGNDGRAADLAQRLGRAAAAVAAEGATPACVAEVAALCQEARRLFTQRHRLVDELAALCREMGAGLVELSEDESWTRGQSQSIQAHLAEGADGTDGTDGSEGAAGPSVRGVRAAAALLAETRAQQQRLRGERAAARTALKQLIQDMLVEVGELGTQAGRFELVTARHAEAIERADSVAGLAGVVKALLADTRAVQAAVGQAQQRLHADRDRAGELEARVRELESELRRLSDEVSTDVLTQVANRRGLMQAFEAESARSTREAATLAVALIDIDNFKKLNDSLGHAAGDVALKSLAAAVRERLRPGDHLARFGGEEFVVLLPATVATEAQQVLTRLQRSLSEALFLHDGREVFVTFSAGVTAWIPGEALALALERADEALYEAKRSGKNRTCLA
jgi:diguanylate cyclase